MLINLFSGYQVKTSSLFYSIVSNVIFSVELLVIQYLYRLLRQFLTYFPRSVVLKRTP